VEHTEQTFRTIVMGYSPFPSVQDARNNRNYSVNVCQVFSGQSGGGSDLISLSQSLHPCCVFWTCSSPVLPFLPPQKHKVLPLSDECAIIFTLKVLCVCMYMCVCDWSLNLGLGACKADALLQPHLQSILLCLFWRWGLADHFIELASN
jgi:hypothetical protein